jgi:hypothetical protein
MPRRLIPVLSCLLALGVGCADPPSSVFDSAAPDSDAAPAPDAMDIEVAVDLPPALDAMEDDGASFDVADVPDAPEAEDRAEAGDVAGEEMVPFDATPPTCPAPFVSTITLPSATPIVWTGTTSGASRNASASCQSNASGPENFHRLDVTARSVVSLSTVGGMTDFDTILALRRACESAAGELACNDDGDVSSTSSRLRALVEPGSYALVVDGFNGATGRYQLTARATLAALNGACTTATALTSDETLRAQRVDGGYDGAFACQPVADAGQLFYTLTIPAGSAGTVTVTPEGTPADWGPVVRVYDRCGATSCLGVSSAPPGSPGVVTVNNESASSRVVRVSVSPASGVGGTFAIGAVVAAPRVGSACSMPLALTPGVDARGSFVDATVSTDVCRASATGRVLYYRVMVAAATRVDLVVTPDAGAAWTPVLRVLEACDAGCVADGQGAVAGAPYALSFANGAAAARSYLIAVGASASTPGTFTLRATTTALAEGARCATPFWLRPDVPAVGRNLADGVDALTTCRATATGRVQYYTVDVPARSIATLRVTPSAGWTPVVRVLAGCDATACQLDELGTFGASSTHVFANDGPTDRRVVVAIGATTVGTAGTYDLALSVTPSLTGEVCTQPVIVTPGAALLAQRLEDGRLSPSVCRVSGGPVRYYALTVNGRQAFTLRVTPAAMPLAWTPQVRVTEGCTATTCEFDALGSLAAPLSVTGVNDGVSPRTYILSVNATSAAVTTGTYDLLATVSTPAAGAVCDEPVALVPEVPLPAQNTVGGGVSSFACLPASTGGQLFYSLRIPAGQRARVVATPAAGTTAAPVLRALDACVASSCVASVVGTSAGATLDVANYDPTPRDVRVSLGGSTRTTPGTWSLLATLAPARVGQFCEQSIALIPGVTERGSTTTGVTTASGCLGGSFGPQVFYRVNVPGGRRVTVSALPMTATAALRVRAVASCAATACVTSSTSAAAGAPASVVLTNATLADRQVFVSVAGSLATTVTDFAITTTDEALTPPVTSPYAAALISASCDALSGATTVAPAAGWSDESVTALAPLPFALRFFGEAVTRFAVSSNGNLQLFDAEGASASPSGFNGAIPTIAAPNGLVAPFWDDFAADGLSVVRTATLGTVGARRFVVEWRNWRFLAEPGAPLNFQAKLFEASGVVEFHYCPSSSVGTERTLGASATIGLEDRSGTAAALVALDWPGMTRPGNGWRLTPR